MAIRIICRDCGSTEVTRDAWAAWNVDRQQWELGAVFDDGYCHSCEGPTSLEEQVVLTVVEGS